MHASFLTQSEVPPAGPLVRAADAYCRYLTEHHYENFIVASGLVNARVRRDLMRIYAYCRTTDDLGDESGQQALALLMRWRTEVEALFAGEPPVHPVLVALRETIARFALPSQPFFDLIAANVQDQRITSYETWPQLEAYCKLSAAPVGRMVLRIFGLENETALRLSDNVCIGLQLANHAQDVTRDAAIGRSYLLASDLRAGEVPAAVRALCDRARSLLASGQRLETLVPFALRLQLALYRFGGLAICDAIARIGYRTDLQRPAVTGGAKFLVLLRALAAAIAPRVRKYDAEPA